MNPEEIKDLKEWDTKHLWHPFTPMSEYAEEDPLIIARGEKNTLYDVEDNAYLDGISSLWTNVHGHNHPTINKAITEQLGKVAHTTLLGITNKPAVRLAMALTEITPPGLSRTFFSDNGSTAVEAALKIAYQYHRQKYNREPKRSSFITFSNAYHGDTIGSVSLGGIERFHETYRKLLFPTYEVPSTYCYRCPVGEEKETCNLKCFGRLERLLETNGHEIAAIVVEPLVQGAAGMITFPEGALRRLRELADRAGTLLIADEVAVGFGRTGSMFACSQEDVTPDLLCLAKGITGGYLPLAATLATEEIYSAFLGRPEENRTFFHGHTYTGNPLAAVAALASLQVFKEEKTLSGLQPKIKKLWDGLEIFKELHHVGEVRGLGVLVGIEIVHIPLTKRPFPPAERVGHRVIMEARKKGVILRPLGDVIVLNPPLSITSDEIEKLLDVTYNSIKLVTKETAGRYSSVER
ncbi:MAG: adenosylmethionine--8-amino-7-oxononanoate transaminase [Planctomycetota bacterium]|nr:MAG: adenosylmethionine--8-amino-7-oxononanoate transaminase [Planctomycetota bacterium]